jgi:hypothetical protein
MLTRYQELEAMALDLSLISSFTGITEKITSEAVPSLKAQETQRLAAKTRFQT